VFPFLRIIPLKFESLELHPKLLASVRKSEYDEPTPIQAKAIPKILLGHDLLGIAQTGTGKTAAFVLPILHRLMAGGRAGSRALVIAPTRELAEQIHESFTLLGKKVNLKSTPIYGGVGIGPQIDRLRNGKDIVVACPGRLLDHIERGTIDLSKVETLVIDEADRLFDMGFFPDLKKIIARLPKKRQSLLFSATMPEAVKALANKILKEPELVEVDEEITPVTISHSFYQVDAPGKTELLMRFLFHTKTESVLVFTQTKGQARKLADALERGGLKAGSLQSDLTQSKRQAAISGFKEGRIKVLVATDIVARGIDVSTISHVINYDMVTCVDDYVHRTGRTGRACREGRAVSLVTHDDQKMVKTLEEALSLKIQQCKAPGTKYDWKPRVAAKNEREEYKQPRKKNARYGKAKPNRGGPRSTTQKRLTKPKGRGRR
jgi:ATP-dependent RNA helicase RhlE